MARSAIQQKTLNKMQLSRAGVEQMLNHQPVVALFHHKTTKCAEFCTKNTSCKSRPTAAAARSEKPCGLRPGPRSPGHCHDEKKPGPARGTAQGLTTPKPGPRPGPKSPTSGGTYWLCQRPMPCPRGEGATLAAENARYQRCSEHPGLAGHLPHQAQLAQCAGRAHWSKPGRALLPARLPPTFAAEAAAAAAAAAAAGPARRGTFAGSGGVAGAVGLRRRRCGRSGARLPHCCRGCGPRWRPRVQPNGYNN